MTVVATWYRKQFDEIWCASDTRISSIDTIITDNGPKILPIPVNVHLDVHPGTNAPRYIQHQQFTLGFAYAGNTLSAIGTYAHVSACTLNLACDRQSIAPPSVSGVAELFRNVGEHYIRDISSRMIGTQDNPDKYAFEAHILGFCRASNRYRAFVIFPQFLPENFSMKIAELNLIEGKFFTLGIGGEALNAINQSFVQSGKPDGVIISLREMLKKDSTPNVGGYFQIGIANPSGFNLCPILNTNSPAPGIATASFLGINIPSPIDNYHIGYRAFDPNID
jgi:hypothetical protein